MPAGADSRHTLPAAGSHHSRPVADTLHSRPAEDSRRMRVGRIPAVHRQVGRRQAVRIRRRRSHRPATRPCSYRCRTACPAGRRRCGTCRRSCWSDGEGAGRGMATSTGQGCCLTRTGKRRLRRRRRMTDRGRGRPLPPAAGGLGARLRSRCRGTCCRGCAWCLWVPARCLGCRMEADRPARHLGEVGRAR